MIKVALVDDNPQVCTQLEKALAASAVKRGVNVDTAVYYSGESFCSSLDRGRNFDLLFMDIELEELNGIDAVDLVRNKYGNERMRIVFISAKAEYAGRLFEHDVMNFLVKPFTDEAVDEVLAKYVRVYHRERSRFSFKFKQSVHQVDSEDIMYFESEKRVVHLVTERDSYKFYDTLENVMNRLDDDRFCKVRQSYVVNLLYVKSYQADHLTLKNGKTIPVSRANREALAEKQLSFYFGGEKVK